MFLYTGVYEKHIFPVPFAAGQNDSRDNLNRASHLCF